MSDNKNNCPRNESVSEKIKKLLEEKNKNIRYCYVKGDKGDKGDKGESGGATIDVGTTETIEAFEEASVSNVGTNTDVILNFKIPKGERGDKGEKGDKGDTGPRGLPGEIGISEVITIDGTETIEPNEEASVIDDFDRNIHHLTFYIPKGEKGEQGEKGDVGPQGEKGDKGDTGGATIDVGITETLDAGEEASVTNVGTNTNVILNFKIPKGEKGEEGEKGAKGDRGERGAPNGVGGYGARYADKMQTFNLTKDAETIIPLEETTTALFVIYNSSYAIQVSRIGIYLINYFLNFTPTTDMNYTLYVKTTNVKVPGTEIKGSAKANTATKINGSTIFALTLDEEITLMLISDTNTEITIDAGNNALLSVIKLD